MKSKDSDEISRADLALVLKSASELQASRSDDAAISVSEAERIASEVGIGPVEFRTALRTLRSSRVETSVMLGADSVLSAETTIERGVGAEEAARMLTQAQISLPGGGAVEVPVPGTWRSSSRTTLIQVATQSGKTSVAAVVNRRLSKLGMISGGAWLGTIAGFTIIPSFVLGLGASAAGLALAQAIGVLGGAGGGFFIGRSVWTASAKRTQARVLLALERMKEVAEIETCLLSGNTGEHSIDRDRHPGPSPIFLEADNKPIIPGGVPKSGSSL